MTHLIHFFDDLFPSERLFSGIGLMARAIGREEDSGRHIEAKRVRAKLHNAIRSLK
jgi:hypothetical protein